MRVSRTGMAEDEVAWLDVSMNHFSFGRKFILDPISLSVTSTNVFIILNICSAKINPAGKRQSHRKLFVDELEIFS